MSAKSNSDYVQSEITGTTPKSNELRRFLKVLFGRPVVIFGVFIILMFLVLAIFAPQIAPHDPNEQNLYMTLQQPSSDYLLGTDSLGRDLLSRLIYGTRISLLIGVVAVSIASITGMLLGLIAGFFGGWINNIIMRVIDAMMAIPPIILALVIATSLGQGLHSVMISLGIAMIPGYCRMMCAQVLTIKETDFILATRSIGAKNFLIMFRHILPNAFPTLLVLITLNIGSMILAEAGLSFLGVGIKPPTAAWGAMVSEGYKFLFRNPLLSFAPGISVVLLVLSYNLVGDGFRDALDPKLRGII